MPDGNSGEIRIIDEEGIPATFARFEIRDEKSNVPRSIQTSCPDFFFQRHIYRGDGEEMALPPGDYTLQVSRGPETLTETIPLRVGDKPTKSPIRFAGGLIPLNMAGGQETITFTQQVVSTTRTLLQGVKPEDMIRHLMGEDLKVGCCLTWGPCFDFQKRFFTGDVAEQSLYPYTLRYDVEVSGFLDHTCPVISTFSI